jgi:hypothetical protein
MALAASGCVAGPSAATQPLALRQAVLETKQLAQAEEHGLVLSSLASG